MEPAADNYFKTQCPKCKRSVFVTREDLNGGVSCVHCGGWVIAGAGEPERGGDGLGEDVDGMIDEQRKSRLCPNCNVRTFVIRPDKALVQCHSCNALFPRELAEDASDANAPPPDDKRLALLRRLGVVGDPESLEQITNILRETRGAVEKSVKPVAPSFDLLPNELRTMIIERATKSNLFHQMYFSDQKAPAEEINPILEAVLTDPDLLAGARCYVEDERFTVARRHVDEFGRYVYRIDLDRGQPEILALKAFGRGFGKRLRGCGGVLYDGKGGRVEVEGDSSPAKKSQFYHRKNEANTELSKLFADNGFEVKEEVPKRKGCLPVLLLGAALVWGTIWSVVWR